MGLIAIMGDSYDFVRENQRLYGLKEKAKALYDIDHSFFTVAYFGKDKYFPKYLHVLTRKDGDNVDEEEEKWEGHLNRLKREIQKNSKDVTDKMGKNSKELKTEISEKMENNSKELKMEISAELSEMRKEIQEIMSDKIENNSKELKEDMKDLESKLDQLLELLSKPQNPD